MNARSDNRDAMRDAEIARLTAEHTDRIRTLAASGEPITLATVADAWTSTLENNELAAQIVRVSAAEPDALGSLVKAQIEQAIAGLADTAAMADVEQMERDCVESADEARAERGAWDRAMAKLPELTTK
jgi:hypothetical protein